MRSLRARGAWKGLKPSCCWEGPAPFLQDWLCVSVSGPPLQLISMLTAMSGLCHLANLWGWLWGFDLLFLQFEKTPPAYCSCETALLAYPPRYSCIVQYRASPALQNSGLILGDMTFLAVQIAVAGETHSRAWMPAFSQMAGRRLPLPVLNWKEKEARKLPSCLACLYSPLLSSSHLTPIHLNHLRPFRDQMFLRAPSIYQVSPGQGA